MANGGHICCERCTYNRLTPGTCDIFGIETNQFVLCRAFRYPGQSHTESRNKFPMLKDLKPGVVYRIENLAGLGADPQQTYRLIKIETKK
jgi:hypothetical protein